MNKKIYDVIILGAGPAGLAAGSYAGRARMDTLIIEKSKVGGQIVITAEIENYPGSIEDETGPSLVERIDRQAQKFGAQKVFDTIVDVELEGNTKHLKGLKSDYYARTVIIATGANPKLIGCKGERELTGKGVSYCATCDGAFFEGFEIYVVGGGDSAIEEALYLTKFARKVTIIHRREELRATKWIQEKAFLNPRIEFIWDSVVEELKGDGVLNSMVVRNVKKGELTEITACREDGIIGVFVFIGISPNSSIFEGKIEMKDGYIVTNDNMETNIPGVYAAGDIRAKSLRQVVTATADGAVAAVRAGKFVECL